MPPDFDCRAGWLIDGDQSVLARDVLLQIRKGQIHSTGPFREAHKNPAHPFFDWRESTLLPPIIDAHVHLTMSGTQDADTRARQLDFDSQQAAAVIDRHIAAHENWGVRGVRDGGDHHGHVLGFRKSRLADRRSAFVLRSPGKAWHSTGRYGRLIGRPPAAAESLPDEIHAAAAGGIDHVKLVQSGLNSLTRFGHQTPPQFEIGPLQRAAAVAHTAGLTVMVHANGPQPVRQAVLAGCDSIEHGFFMGPECLSLMAEHGTLWVPTAVTMAAYAERLAEDAQKADIARRTFDDQCRQIETAHRLGVAIAAGSDAGSLGVDHGTGLWQEIAILIRAGLTPAAAVKCAVANGARLIGLPASRIAKGRTADFLVLRGSPQDLAHGLPRIEARCRAARTSGTAPK